MTLQLHYWESFMVEGRDAFWGAQIADIDARELWVG